MIYEKLLIPQVTVLAPFSLSVNAKLSFVEIIVLNVFETSLLNLTSFFYLLLYLNNNIMKKLLLFHQFIHIQLTDYPCFYLQHLQ